MKVAIFGANGRTGKELVIQSLIKGYNVTAFVRNPDNIDITHEKLNIIQGNIIEYSAVENAIKDTDVVLVSVGSGRQKQKNLHYTGTENIVRAMEKHSVRRLIVQSSAGLFGAKDSGFIFGSIIKPLFLKKEFEDKIAQLNILRESSLDWILVRPVSLIDGMKTGKYHITLDKPQGKNISRADVAEFMLNQISSSKYLKQMPLISY